MSEPRNILVVDSETGVLSTLERTFRHDYNFFAATNSKDALSIMGENDIDLIITDHRIRGMTGFEFLEKVSRKYPDTVRIILTAYIDETLLMDAMRIHVHKYVIKPWETEEIREIVRENLGVRRREVGQVWEQ